MQARRDDARQAAVHVADLNIKQQTVDTYMAASSDSDDDKNNDNSYSYDPKAVYDASMNYSKNQALMSAFENIDKNGIENKHHVSVMV